MFSIKTQLTGVSLFGFLFLAQPAYADLSAQFDEGAPKDRFTFTNIGACAITNATLTLDLSTSDSGLIFDVTDQGAGVEVFQPFELIKGGDAISGQPNVLDGDAQIVFSIRSLMPQKAISFTIDVDDTTGGREITVSDGEIKGASVMLEQNSTLHTATFVDSSRTKVKLNAC